MFCLAILLFRLVLHVLFDLITLFPAIFSVASKTKLLSIKKEMAYEIIAAASHQYLLR